MLCVFSNPLNVCFEIIVRSNPGRCPILLDFWAAVGTKRFRLPQGREVRPRWHFLFSLLSLGQGHLVARPASVGSSTFSFVDESWSGKTAVLILILWISSVAD